MLVPKLQTFIYDTKEGSNLLLCLSRLLVTRIPEHFTGPCTVALAIERFILVCVPFKASTWLSKRNRLLAYSTILTLMITAGVFEISYAVTSGRFSDLCMFFPNADHEWIEESWEKPQYPSVVSAALLYALPAVVSILFYIKVGSRLLRKKNNASRNQIITVALFLSCVCWILLWGAAYFLKFSHYYLECEMHQLFICLTGWAVKSNSCEFEHWFYHEILEIKLILGSFSALMNSVCMILVVKKFWKPAEVVLHPVSMLLEWISAVIHY